MTFSETTGAVLHHLGFAPRLMPLAIRDRNFVRSRLRHALQEYYARRDVVLGWVRLPGGTRCYANLNDGLMKRTVDFGAVEEEVEIQMFAQYVRPGDVMLDVGANYGVFTLEVLARTDGVAAAHLFEPNPAVAACVRRTARRHAALPLIAHEYAVGDVAGQGTFHVPSPEASVHGALSRHAWGEEHGIFADDSGIAVKLTTIDHFCAAHQLERLDCVKIDVEGNEAEVVRGMEHALRRYRPRVIMCETSVGSETYLALRQHYARADVVVGNRRTVAASLGEGLWGNVFFTEPIGPV